MPSLPTNTPRRSSPAGSGSSPPSTATVAVGQHDLDGEDVGVGDALGEAVRPARVVGDVAADRARLLAARVGGEVQAVRGDGRREVEVEHARLDPRQPVAGSTERIRFIFVVTMTTAPSSGTAPPARPVPEPRATNGTPWRRGDAHARLHLGGGQREADDRRRALHVRGVAAVQRQLGRPVADAVRRRAPRAARRRATASRGCRHRRASIGASGRRIRITRPDSTGSPSTSTSSPGREVVAEAHEPAVALGPQLALAPAPPARPSRTASATRRPRALHRAGGAAGRRSTGASLRGRGGDLALGVAGTGGAGGDAADEPHDRRIMRLAPQPPRRLATRARGDAGGLDHRRRQRRPGDAGCCRPTASLIASAEPRTRSKRSRSSRASSTASRGRRRSTSRSSPAAAPSRRAATATSARSAPQRVAHPHQRRRPARRRPSAQSTAPTTTAAHRRSSLALAHRRVRPCLMRSAISCSCPWSAGLVPACGPTSSSGRYCWATQPRSWSWS